MVRFQKPHGQSGGAMALSAREHDCLRLLAAGLRTAEAAAELGISKSTLSAHLAAARRKLGVRTTMEAVSKTVSLGHAQDRDAARLVAANMMAGELSQAQIALLNRLAECRSFTEAWHALHAYLATSGVTAFTFGLIADPAGNIEDGNWMRRTSMSDEIDSLYRECGGVPADPCARYTGSSTKPLIVPDCVELLRGAFLQTVPSTAVRRLAECVIDQYLNSLVVLPGRDPATAAPYGLVLAYDRWSRSEFAAMTAHHIPELRRTAALFWDFIQHAGLLAHVPKLTQREREALQLIVRGFALAEIAERLNVSTRSAEKFLAGARSKLGARNNAQAVYRSMVYRALV